MLGAKDTMMKTTNALNHKAYHLQVMHKKNIIYSKTQRTFNPKFSVLNQFPGMCYPNRNFTKILYPSDLGEISSGHLRAAVKKHP